MEIRSEQEARQNVEDFTKEYLKLLAQKKAIDAEITEMKNRYKEDGVPTSVVCKVLNKIKSEKKKTPTAKSEENIITDWLEDNRDIDDMLVSLMSK